MLDSPRACNSASVIDILAVRFPSPCAPIGGFFFNFYVLEERERERATVAGEEAVGGAPSNAYNVRILLRIASVITLFGQKHAKSKLPLVRDHDRRPGACG